MPKRSSKKKRLKIKPPIFTAVPAFARMTVPEFEIYDNGIRIIDHVGESIVDYSTDGITEDEVLKIWEVEEKYDRTSGSVSYEIDRTPGLVVEKKKDGGRISVQYTFGTMRSVFGYLDRLFARAKNAPAANGVHPYSATGKLRRFVDEFEHSLERNQDDD